MLLLTALKSFTPKKIRALRHLMVKMTTLSALSLERSVAYFKPNPYNAHFFHPNTPFVKKSHSHTLAGVLK